MATHPIYAYVLYAGTGASTNYTFHYPYLQRDHIKVLVDDVEVSYSFVNGNTVKLNVPAPRGSIVEIRRETVKKDVPVDYVDGSVLAEKDLDALALYTLYASQEDIDRTGRGLNQKSSGEYLAKGQRITNVADPVGMQDVATRRSTVMEVGRALEKGVGPYLVDTYASPDGASFVGYRPSTGPAMTVESALRAVLERPPTVFDTDELRQELVAEMHYGFAEAGTEIYPGSSNAMQGMVVLNVQGNDFIFASQRYATVGGVELSRIVLFPFTTDGGTVSHIEFSQSLDIGHGQDLGGYVDDAGQVWLYTTTTSAGKGRGFARIKWRGGETSQVDVTDFIVLGGLQRDYEGAYVGTTEDGSRIVLIASRNEGQSRVVMTYDRREVESSHTPYDVAPVTVFDVGRPAFSNNALQGITANKHGVVLAYGYLAPLGYHGVVVYDWAGNMIRSLEFDDARALHGYETLMGASSLGIPMQIELEGVTLVDDDLFVTVLDTWATPGDVVEYQGGHYAAITTNSTEPPDNTSQWVKTLLPTTRGPWATGTAYTRGERTRRSKLIYRVGVSGAEPLLGAIPRTTAPVSLLLDTATPDIAYRAGETLQIWQWNQGLGQFTKGLEMGSDGALRWFDPRRGASQTVHTALTSLYGEGRQIAQLNMGGGVSAPQYRIYGPADVTYPGYVREMVPSLVYAYRETTAEGATQFRAVDVPPLTARRDSTGDLQLFKRNATIYGGIYTTTANFTIGARNGAHLRFACEPGESYTGAWKLNIYADGRVTPGADNVQTLGEAPLRWATIFAGTGTINTSDEREKPHIQPIDEAALRAWARVEYCQFKFKDAVQSKGDKARWHFGVIAQRVKDSFGSEGIDPFAYGILCYDEWDEQAEVVGDDGEIIQPFTASGSRYGIRYEEALALECAYQRQLTADIQVRLAALEAR